jgi:hypothetical protein
MSQRLLALALFLTPVALLGCQATPPRAELTPGSWRGTGTFVAAQWDTPSNSGNLAPAIEAARAQPYDTTLKITAIPDSSPPALRFEIISRRGKLLERGTEQAGDITHLVLTLQETQRLSDDAVIYALTAAEATLQSDNSPEDADTPATPLDATGLRAAGRLVLQIRYSDGFTDTFLFDGDDLVKTGAYWAAGDESGLTVHWIETLTRAD